MRLEKTLHVLAVLSALLLAAGRPAAAQGMYYQEVVKDGRIYVFNLGAEYERWQASGEMGKAITKLGYGPGGETVVFDSEDAIDLYNFKHGKAEVVVRPPKPRMEVAWRDGKTRITTDKAYLEVSNRIQARFTHELPDDAVQLAGTADKGDARGSFRIRRAKLKMEGWVYHEAISYEFQANWPGVSGSNAGAILEDAVVDWDVSKKGTFRLRFGQYKPPVGRQEMTSSGNQTFVDRSEVENQYVAGRETGFGVWGALGNRIEYRASVFNGNGPTRSANDNDAFMYAARVMWQPNGAVPLRQRAWVSGPLWSESDFETTDRPFYAIAAGFLKNDFHRATTGNDLADTVWALDGLFKYKGFAATAEVFRREREPETGASFDSNGGFAQASYLVGKARQWEVAARYGRFRPTDAVGANARKELRLGASYYYNKHNLKVQADFGRLEDEAADSGRGTRNQELRVQTQIIF